MGYIVCLGCYLTQLRVFSHALWIRCIVCIEYSPIYLNYLKPWTCVYLRYTSGTAFRDTRTVGRYIFKRLCVAYHLRHLFCDSYLRQLLCDLYLRHLLYDLMNLHLFYKLLNCAWQLKYSRMLCRRWLWWFSCWLICACDICWCLHAPDLDLTFLCRDCVFIYECPSRGWTMIFWIYGRWHGSCLYCAWFIYRSTCWHAVMIFNVVIHLSWCVISLTIWTSYWINGIHLLSCPHGQGSSKKRGSNF